MKSFFENLWGFKREQTPMEVPFFRILEIYALGYTLYFTWTWAFEIQNLVDVILPLGLANYLDISLWFDNNVPVWSAGLLTLFAFLAIFRIKPAFSYWALLLLFHLQYAARYSQGEISHGSNFVGTTVLMYALGFSVFNEALYTRRFIIGNLFFFLGLGYTSAAICKMIGTGLHWFDAAHLQLWIGERTIDTISKFGFIEYNLLQEQLMEHGWASSITLLFGLLAELFGFLLWFRKTRYLMIPVLIGMHLGIYWSMNILFDMFIYQLLVMMIPYEWIGKAKPKELAHLKI